MSRSRLRPASAPAWLAALALLAAAIAAPAAGDPPGAASRARLSAGRPDWVIVEFDTGAVDQDALTERLRRHLKHDDAALLARRSAGYARVKGAVERDLAGPDATPVRDYSHFPLALWRISSLDALRRLRAHRAVRAVHGNERLYATSVSDLGFIGEPQAAALGAQGAGTTIAVIDGGLGSNYLAFGDFGTCTAIAMPSACRVVYDHEFYPGASTVTVHGTNVATIALGVAPGARLAMFDVFNGAGASIADVLTAMNEAVGLAPMYNVAAINMSLGDGSSHAGPCTTSAFTAPVTNAAHAGIVTVAAAGNNGSKYGLQSPACTPGVVSVGAVYDAAYGTQAWLAPALAAGQCSDASAADVVACFSQSASYLTLLAPGSYVSAPSAAFQESGTSQAAPHVAGAVAVLRARYPAESLAETIQRLTSTGIPDADAHGGFTTPRLDLYAAVELATAVSLAGSGPLTATAGQTSSYSLSVSNAGPLAATGIVLTDAIPAGSAFVSASQGCGAVQGIVTCALATLGVNASVTFTITVLWRTSGPAYDVASVTFDQLDSLGSGAQVLALGTVQQVAGDGPLPGWATALLAVGLLALGFARLPHGAARRSAR